MTRALLLAVALASAAAAWSGATQERPWTPLPSPQSSYCPDGLCQAEALVPLFRALDGRWGGVVRIVQFGDSHTAGRLITDALETRLRARFQHRDIRLEPIGEVGVTLNDLAERNLPLLDAAPDLIILEYGVNEGFDETLYPPAYERLMRTQIARLKAEAPGAALLILGPPDAMRGDGGGVCPDDPERRWNSPAMLAVVREVQGRVAAETGVAFWDWRGRMGGECSAHRLTLGAEPLMRGDHVHFTAAGADWIGGLLYDDLMTAGRAWYREAGPFAATGAGV